MSSPTPQGVDSPSIRPCFRTCFPLAQDSGDTTVGGCRSRNLLYQIERGIWTDLEFGQRLSCPLNSSRAQQRHDPSHSRINRIISWFCCRVTEPPPHPHGASRCLPPRPVMTHRTGTRGTSPHGGGGGGGASPSAASLADEASRRLGSAKLTAQARPHTQSAVRVQILSPPALRAARARAGIRVRDCPAGPARAASRSW